MPVVCNDLQMHELPLISEDEQLAVNNTDVCRGMGGIP